MECPKCAVEFQLHEDEHANLQRCGQCGGIWLDIADLNRMLLHHNLSGLEKLGGKANIEELAGQCPQCLVDLVVVEGGPRRSQRYDTCESCGGIWLEQGLEHEETLAVMVEGIVSFFKKFGMMAA
ncbi:MAG: zf-TFIIB domain-containing protein [Deltaproteobacteria bacterium]